MNIGLARMMWIGSAALLFLILAILGFLCFCTLREFHPAGSEILKIHGYPGEMTGARSDFTFLTWNIGYAGLGKEMDFFYDGGKRSRSTRHEFERYYKEIKEIILRHRAIDFILLQEVDNRSRRSFFTDETKGISDLLPGHSFSFAINYRCDFVPVPITDPVGRVHSGLMTFSTFRPDSSIRIGLDLPVSWPKRLFYLKRCFIISRFSLPGKKELLIVNIHLSAFDTGGIWRTRELEKLRDFLVPEYKKGNYIVAGGDWNANPPGFSPEQITSGDKVKTDPFLSPDTFFPGWKFASDSTRPTNRDLIGPYEKGATKTTILDFYLVSPNVTIREVKTIETGFRSSDHQPVSLTISLNDLP
jgi:endonuclease/exonuclease/phosphatase family metal-dependent hydrolase